MQTLWSRAIQSQCRCKCGSCISRTSSVARRVGSSGVKAPWGFSAPSSTLPYSSFFAPATVADGHSKPGRYKPWDNAISAAQRALGSARKDAPENEGTSEGSDSVLDAAEAPTTNEHDDDLWEMAEFDSRAPGAVRPSWPINTGPDLDRNDLPPQSLWSRDWQRKCALRTRYSWKKRVVIELGIARLIHRLLLRSGALHADERTLDAFPDEIRSMVKSGEFYLTERKRFLKYQLRLICQTDLDYDLESLEIDMDRRRVSCVIPQYYQDDNGDFLDICKELNFSMKALLERQNRFPPTKQLITVAKICHNLLTSSAPPDIETFNLLLLGFHRWNRPELCHIVIVALDDAKVRPNELTCAAALRHFVNTDDPTLFSEYISRMRGMTNSLMLARPDVRIESEGARRRLIRTESGKVYQKIYPTPLVFRQLMRGVLKFAGFDRAMEIYYEMKQDGWGLDTKSVARLFHDCAISGAWIDGYLLWEEFQHLRGKGNIDRYLPRFYASMLALCERMGKQVAYNEVLVEGIAAGLSRYHLAKTAHFLAEKAKSVASKTKRAQDPAQYERMGDSMLIALSHYAEEIKEYNEHEMYTDWDGDEEWDGLLGPKD